MRIGIDARLAGLKHAGIGRYIEELLRSLLRTDAQHQWVVFLHSEGQLPWLEADERVEIRYAPIKHYTLMEQIMMPKVYEQASLDLLHIPHFNVPLGYKKPYVVTIHDLLWHERRDRSATTLSPLMHLLKYRTYRYISETAIRNAKAVFVPTEHVKHIVERYTVSDRVFVTPEGVSSSYKIDGPKAERPYPFIVYTGSLYPHKNAPFILELLLREQELHAVIVSGRSVFHSTFWDEVKHRKLETRVHLDGYLPDNEVAALYRSAVALIFPSFSEGFGLPGLEAIACGAPVMASDISVFHEVYGKAALYFSPFDVSSCVKELKRLKSESVVRTLRNASEDILKKYSWNHMAKDTLRVYEQVGE
ncbi:MAG TPA: glycosyltransferase family 1 protein [Patescibacteria group bacterium]|nr:glycosyltransferase family 1 protein [Patescibacteria group bacterium]